MPLPQPLSQLVPLKRLAYRTFSSVEYGKLEKLSPLVHRIVCANPGPFTYAGTGTYIVGLERGADVAVIDPGPEDDTHLRKLLEALVGVQLSHIFITHTHSDHSPLARMLQASTGARTYGWPQLGLGPEAAGGLEEAVDVAFKPDVELKHGDVIDGRSWHLEAVHTPGHMSNHVCLALQEEKALFTGDHVMGWSTTVVSPPLGHMGDYLRSLELCRGREEDLYYPTHGPPVEQARAYVGDLLEHRWGREAQITALLAGMEDKTSISAESLVPTLYADVPQKLHGAAARSVLAHLIHLVEQGSLRHNESVAGEPQTFSLPHAAEE